MGMIVEFFVASSTELEEAFAGWCFVSDEKGEEVFTNPFTGENQTVMTWQPAGLIGEGKDNAFQNVLKLTHFSCGRIDPIKIATLQELLCDTDYAETFDEIVKPALLHAEYPEECGLHCLPAVLVKGLTELDDRSASSISNQWCETDEMKADRAKAKPITEFLIELSAIAKASMNTKKPMYYLWSL